MIWLILLTMLLVGCYLIFKGKTRGYKILGYVLVSSILIFSVMIVSSIGVKTNEIIEEDSSVIFD